MSLLDQVRIATPCTVGWSQMHGDDRVRHCDECNLNVYNFSEMTSREVEQLVRQTEGRLCGRIYRRADGTMLTRDCPVGLRAVRLQIARAAAMVIAALLGAARPLSAQAPSPAGDLVQLQAAAYSSFCGTVTDISGAAVADASVVLKSAASGSVIDGKTDAGGRFCISSLPHGDFSVLISMAGFIPKKDTIKVERGIEKPYVLEIGSTEQGGLMVSAESAPARQVPSSRHLPVPPRKRVLNWLLGR